MFRSPPPRRKAKDITGDKHIARALHAILQRPGMPVNVITNGAVQVMVDMMRDLMERVMDEAATCADSNGRVTIKSGNIMTGARLVMHQNIGPYGGGCPEIEKRMCSFATQRYTEYHEYLGWEERQAQAIESGAPSIAAPDRSRPAAMKLRPIPDRFVPDHLSHLRGVRGFRPLSYWD
jgi:histone H3/H4